MVEGSNCLLFAVHVHSSESEQYILASLTLSSPSFAPVPRSDTGAIRLGLGADGVVFVRQPKHLFLLFMIMIMIHVRWK
jgi:hypothetical protein